MPTAKQKKFIDRFVAKVTSMGVTVDDPTSPSQVVQLVGNNWLVITISMPTDSSPEIVKLTARLPGSVWPTKQMTIAQFERINVDELNAIADRVRQTKEEIADLNIRVKTLRDNLTESVTSSFLNV